VPGSKPPPSIPSSLELPVETRVLIDG